MARTDRRGRRRRRGRGPPRRAAVLPVPDRSRVGVAKADEPGPDRRPTRSSCCRPRWRGPGWPPAATLRRAGHQARLLHGPRPAVPPAAPVRRPARDAQARRPAVRRRRRRRLGPGDASATSGSSPASAAGSSGRSPGSRTTPGSIDATWFGRRFIERRLHGRRRGRRVRQAQALRPTADARQPRVPGARGRAGDTELLHAGRIVPVYPLTAGLTAIRLRAAIREALDKAGYAYPEYLPGDDRAATRTSVPIARAIEEAHYPASFEGRDAALRRLAFDELLALQLGMVARRRQRVRDAAPGDRASTPTPTRPSGRRSSDAHRRARRRSRSS